MCLKLWRLLFKISVERGQTDYEEFELYGTDWEAGGYFDCPSPNGKIRSDWTTYRDCLEQAKYGRFNKLSELVTIVSTTTDPVLQYACAELLGDATPSDSFEGLRHYVSEKGWIDQQLHSSHALSVQGHLASVLPMLSIYTRDNEYKDAAFVPTRPRSTIRSYGGVSQRG